jgi:hypothetical protein
MDIAELVARESIRDLVARYNSTADTGRFDDTMALFAPDAVMDIDGRRYEGIGAIRGLFVGTKDEVAAHAGDRPAYLRHCTATLQIDLTSATTAKGRCYYFVLMAHGLDHWGRYMDEYALVDGRWVFTLRREKLDGSTPGGFVG